MTAYPEPDDGYTIRVDGRDVPCDRAMYLASYVRNGDRCVVRRRTRDGDVETFPAIMDGQMLYDGILAWVYDLRDPDDPPLVRLWVGAGGPDLVGPTDA